jgi:hypothetical protein
MDFTLKAGAGRSINRRLVGGIMTSPGAEVGKFFPPLGIFCLHLDKILGKFAPYSPLERRKHTMTRTVTEQAMRLLTKSVSDIAGEERRIADALVTSLRSNEKVFAAPVHF